MHKSFECIGIDKLIVNRDSIICPNCKYKMDKIVLLELKGFNIKECPGCGKLFLPVKNNQDEYNVCRNIPGEWILSEEEKNEIKSI